MIQPHPKTFTPPSLRLRRRRTALDKTRGAQEGGWRRVAPRAQLGGSTPLSLPIRPTRCSDTQEAEPQTCRRCRRHCP